MRLVPDTTHDWWPAPSGVMHAVRMVDKRTAQALCREGVWLYPHDPRTWRYCRRCIEKVGRPRAVAVHGTLRLLRGGLYERPEKGDETAQAN